LWVSDRAVCPCCQAYKGFAGWIGAVDANMDEADVVASVDWQHLQVAWLKSFCRAFFAETAPLGEVLMEGEFAEGKVTPMAREALRAMLHIS
jgi:hypothetical protein